jgi:hypothetical protein
MKISIINIFFKAVVLSAVCVSGMTVAVVNDNVMIESNKYQLSLKMQHFGEKKYVESKDEDIIIPTAGCPMRPCPGSWLD